MLISLSCLLAQKALKHRRVKHYGFEFRYDNNNVDKDKPLTAGKLSLLFNANIISYNQSFMGHIFINVVFIPITYNNILQCLEFELCCAVLVLTVSF